MKSLLSNFFHHSAQTHSDTRSVKRKQLFPDRFLLFAILLLALTGILMVYDSSVAIAIRDFSNQYYYAQEQFKWLCVGILAMWIVSFIDYHRYYNVALPILLVTIFFLLLVFVPGMGVRALGAHRWVNLRIINFQPAELAKLSLILYLSAWFSLKEKGRFGAFLLLLGMVLGLVILEPDLGTGIIILAIALTMYFLSGAPVSQFLVLLPVLAVGGLGLAVVSPYRFRRLMTFLNPESDPLGASYQIRQALLALGSGNWFGLGIGKSLQKYEYLPEANTDSIFAIVGEEVGFIGCAAVIGLFLFLVWRGFRIAKRAPDIFGQLMAFGISSWVGIQVAVNLAAMVALIPLTGVPLPFISYGGSSLVIILIAMGILLNISKQI